MDNPHGTRLSGVESKEKLLTVSTRLGGTSSNTGEGPVYGEGPYFQSGGVGLRPVHTSLSGRGPDGYPR